MDFKVYTGEKTMRKITALCIVFSLILISCNIKKEMNVNDLEIKEIWQTGKKFQIPESVYYDHSRDVLYVSSLNGNPTEKNRLGYISRLDTDGTLIEHKWVTGLNAPKGMAVFDSILYVSDVDRVVSIDIDEGKIVGSLNLSGSIFLNDLEIDDKGTRYVTDTQRSIIFRIVDNKPEYWLQGKEIDHVNGLYLEDNILYFGNSGSGMIKSVDLESGTITEILDIGRGIDGLKKLNDDLFITSDWQGHVMVISRSGIRKDLIDTSEDRINAADFEYIRKTGMIYVPTFYDNRVVAYKIK
jgi:hypothetical protein